MVSPCSVGLQIDEYESAGRAGNSRDVRNCMNRRIIYFYRRAAVAVALLFLTVKALSNSFLPPTQIGNLLEMTNGNVRLEYDLNSGRVNFYWQNSMKISGFYAGAGLASYITDTVYTNHSWTVSSNQVVVTSSRSDLPTMMQSFIFNQADSFLTRVDVTGVGLQSRWMGPVVMDMPGGVDIGSDNDVRALVVPFDNDSFSFSYNGMPINNTAMSYEVSAFYDNTTRNGLVVGSVTHDTWKTGIYFQGANNRLSVLNAFGGETSSDTRDVMAHGLVTGNIISSPTIFVGFGADWRTVMEAYADANAAMAPKLSWAGGVPFGWNSWYAYGTNVSFSNATAVSDFIKANLQTNHFNNQGSVYINLDSFWSNLDGTQLLQFAAHCHTNGQKAGIYWTPFVYWGTASQGSNSLMTYSTYKWSDAYLLTPGGTVQIVDGGIAIDPTHPAFRQMVTGYIEDFKGLGFDYLKLDFLSHGALEGVHYDTNVTTGIQAYNRGMQYLLTQNAGKMFLSESIAPIFPYQYCHSRRIFCDASTTINDTMNTMQAVTYGWWINNRLYQYSDPDMMKFSGRTPFENQSRLICCAVSGTVFLNSDDLLSQPGQSLAVTCLSNEALNEVARAGAGFRSVENNTGANADDVFARQDGNTWYVAAFNYSASSTNLVVNLPRCGISGAYTAVDLWSGATLPVSGASWTVSLGAKQARLFRLGSGPTSAAGPTNQALIPGSSTTLTTEASGTPPFSYVWSKNGAILAGQTDNALPLGPESLGDAGAYSVQVTGGDGTVTNTATIALLDPINIASQIVANTLQLSWPDGYTGWRLQSQTNATGLGTNWFDVVGSPWTNGWNVSMLPNVGSVFFRLVYP